MTVAQLGQPVEDLNVAEVVDGGHESGGPGVAVGPRMSFAPATQSDTAPAVMVDPPWLAVVHPVGELGMSGRFMPGSLVLGKEFLVAKAGEHLNVIVWDYRTYYKEYLTTDQRKAGLKPRVFLTAAEARAAGLTTEIDPATRALPTAPMGMTWLALVEKPKDLLCDLFFIEVAGRRYAPAYIGLDKSAFLSVKNAFFMAAQFTTKSFGGIRAMRWDLWTRIYEAKSGNKAWVPSIKPVGIMPEDERRAFGSAASIAAGSAKGGGEEPQP